MSKYKSRLLIWARGGGGEAMSNVGIIHNTLQALEVFNPINIRHHTSSVKLDIQEH